MQRGSPPYEGKWAPPGGFVEPYESVEAAAVRETQEEVGIPLTIEQLLPLAISSVQSINQVYFAFLARLDAMIEPVPAQPEALDARWFACDAFPLANIWDPMLRFNMTELFARARSRRFEFFQRTDDFNRVISQSEHIRYLRREAE
jgi:ADP-ribose pyrophosphatase YjhB (NUDIX family)